jgi:selenocysteine lyase/cysteine desulfurase
MPGCQRHLFDLPEGITYLNAAFLGPLTREAAAAGAAALARRAAALDIGAGDFFAPVERARALFARLVGADAEGIAVVPSASYGIAVAARNLPLERGQRVLVPEGEFPSNVLAWKRRCAETGAELATIPRPGDDDWTSAVLAELDGRAAILACPQVHWTDGTLFDLPRLAARCRELGCALAVDATQSLGVMPLDIGALQPDFLVSASYKWLLGPYGQSFLYAAPQRRSGIPLEEAWANREGAEDFTHLTRYHDEYREGARRFEAGERSSFILTPITIASLTRLLDWTPEGSAAYLQALTDRLAEGASELGLDAPARSRRGPHMLGLRFPGEVPEDLAARLKAEGIVVSLRGRAIRVSPHLYNDAADIDRLLAALAPRRPPPRSAPHTRKKIAPAKAGVLFRPGY